MSSNINLVSWRRMTKARPISILEDLINNTGETNG